MPNWVKPFVCLSALVIGIFLSVRPVLLIVLAFIDKQPAAVATIVAALIGFSGVALTTRAGFRNLIASQEAQSARDREARAELRAQTEKQREDDRKYDKTVLAAALHGELLALLGRVHNMMTVLRMQEILWAGMAKNLNEKMEVPVSYPSYEVPIFQASIQRLGLLGPSIAGDVVEVFTKASTKPATDTSPKVNVDMAAKFCDAAVQTHSVLSEEIVQVASRLSYVQGGLQKDPGSLHEMRKAKKAVAAK